MKILRALIAWLGIALSVPAMASFHTFTIQQLYTNADGGIQFVVLKESAGSDNEEFLAGHTLISTAGGVMNTLVFPSDLPSANTANRSVLIATPAFANLGVISPDYIMPAGFLFATGGSLNYAGVDTLIYASLPTDGVNSLYRSGMVAPNQATNFAGDTISISPSSQLVNVIEYHNSVFDHYFITPLSTEIALLDARTPPFQDWSRTGFSFHAYANASAPLGSSPICRFFNNSFAPKSSHFYAAQGFGCEATLALFPDWMLEDNKLFNTFLPDVSGTCPTGTVPVYRLYNNGMGGAPNHRFVIDFTQRQTMINQGWTPEGAGSVGVGMCVP